MANKVKLNVILDIIMFMVMLAIFCVKGEFHETLAYTIGVLLILHIGLHWQQFKTMYSRLIPETPYRHVVTCLIMALITAIITAPFYLNVGSPGPHGHHGPPPSNYYSGDR